MSSSELTLANPGIFSTTRHEEYWRGMLTSALGQFFALDTRILSGVTDFFLFCFFFCKFVHRLLGYLQVLFKNK